MARVALITSFVLVFLGALGHGQPTARDDEEGYRLRGAQRKDALSIDSKDGGAVAPSLGCPAGSAFRIESTLFERANACYILTARSDSSGAYSTSGVDFSAENRTGWGQALVTSFSTYADGVDCHLSSFVSEYSNEIESSCDEGADTAAEGSTPLQTVLMRFWMATFIEPCTGGAEGAEGPDLGYMCFSSKVPNEAHPADAASWSCVRDVEGEGAEPEAVRVDPSQFSLHCGCDALA